AQLAQFSTVEGIEKMNSSIDAMASSFQSSQALQASSMVGRTVVFPSDRAMVDPAEGFTGQFVLPQPSQMVLVNVYDEAGSMVATINLGAQETGIRDFAWDGQDASGNPLPAGKYRFEAQASINGETTQLATLLPANVDSVSLGAGHGGEMVLNLAGLGSIGLSDGFTLGKDPPPNSEQRSLSMSVNIGPSGIRAASSDLNITGNNIANASTVGFKAARAEFGDVYAASILGTGSNAQGSGVVLNNVAQIFTQGNINYTENSLDLAINGNGFFVTSKNGALSYTRAG